MPDSYTPLNMNIDKELREKLVKASSLEEVKTLLGDQATEEETARIWKEIQAFQSDGGREMVDDEEFESLQSPEEDVEKLGLDDLDDVAGGVLWINEEKAANGRAIGCLLTDYHNRLHAAKHVCNQTSNFKHNWVEFNWQGSLVYFRCSSCGAECVANATAEGTAARSRKLTKFGK